MYQGSRQVEFEGPTIGEIDAEAVWRDFGEQLRTFVRRRIAEPDRADDVVGEILLTVHRKLHTLQDPQRLQAWLFRIARNAITDEYRRHARRDLPVTLDDNELLVTESTEDNLRDHDAVLSELADCMQPLLGQLPDRNRRAVELADLQGITQVEAARLEGVSVSGMKSRVQRGRRQLADLLAACCTLTLDTRGMPTDYDASADCSCG